MKIYTHQTEAELLRILDKYNISPEYTREYHHNLLNSHPSLCLDGFSPNDYPNYKKATYVGLRNAGYISEKNYDFANDRKLLKDFYALARLSYDVAKYMAEDLKGRNPRTNSTAISERLNLGVKCPRGPIIAGMLSSPTFSKHYIYYDSSIKFGQLLVKCSLSQLDNNPSLAINSEAFRLMTDGTKQG